MTSTVKLETLPDYKQQFEAAETPEELNIEQTKYIMELRAKIYELWTYIIKADRKKIRVMDLRKEKDKKRYEEYIKE